jgi:hypothetical protein
MYKGHSVAGREQLYLAGPDFIFSLTTSPGCFSRFDVVKLQIGKSIACKKLVFCNSNRKKVTIMNKLTKYILTAFMSAFSLVFLSGCTPPIYEHSIEYHYDAQGKITGHTEKESVTQQSPTASPMKVKINHKDKLEK